jgi:hypothetical protein
MPVGVRPSLIAAQRRKDCEKRRTVTVRMMLEIHLGGENEEQVKTMISVCSLLFSREYGVVLAEGATMRCQLAVWRRPEAFLAQNGTYYNMRWAVNSLIIF